MTETVPDSESRRRRANILKEQCEALRGKRLIVAKFAPIMSTDRTSLGYSLRGVRNTNIFKDDEKVLNFCNAMDKYFQLSEVYKNASMAEDMFNFVLKGHESPPGYFTRGRFATMRSETSRAVKLRLWSSIERNIESAGADISVPTGTPRAIDIKTSFFPPQLVDENFPFDLFYFENASTGEEENRIVIEIADIPETTIDVTIPKKLLIALESTELTEKEKSQLRRFRKFLDDGSDTYLRLSSIFVENSSARPNNIFTLRVVPALFNQTFYREIVALFRKVGLKIEAADDDVQPNIIAVRVGVIRQKAAQKFVVFQRRSDKNYLNPFWVDVGAVGYIKYVPEVSASDGIVRVSIVREAREEIMKELQIDGAFIPHYEGFAFFGLTRMSTNGSLDIICQCEIKKEQAFATPFVPAEYAVARREDILLEPRAIVDFILSDACKGQSDKSTIVPSAIVTLICMLRRAGFAMDDINKEFKRINGRIETDDKVRGRPGLL